MMAQRLIQNFRRSRAILWAGEEFKSEGLERALINLGVSMTRVEHIEGHTLDPDRDIVFFDTDQGISPQGLLAVGSSLPAAPVIGIVGVEAPGRLRSLAEAGGTAILRKPIQVAALYSALFLAVNNFRRLRAMEQRLADHGRKRHLRRYVVKAIVMLVKTYEVDEDEAYALLRRESMRRRCAVEKFCEDLFQPGSRFPHRWPSTAPTSGKSQHGGEHGEPAEEEHENATGGEDETLLVTNKRRIDVVDGTVQCESGGTDQARRA